jgi:AraC-like DNA-binding protein
MFLHFTERPSDSPLVERMWTSHSDRAGTFLSVSQCHVELVVTRHRGSIFATLRGPETRVSRADCPAEGEWVGIRFSLGTFFPAVLPAQLRDRRDANLPMSTSRTFLLDGSAWEFPTYENADTFVARLVRRGLIARDGDVARAAQGVPPISSTRSVQRRFQQATGLTYRLARQIERARLATTLLMDGLSILDTVDQAGYYDQAHLTRSLKHFIGQTPGEIVAATQQLSFLYKTAGVVAP